VLFVYYPFQIRELNNRSIAFPAATMVVCGGAVVVKVVAESMIKWWW